jgi:5'-phosphate synthase pdxT subunit
VVTSVGRVVRVLARVDQGIVALEYGKHIAFSFHPELGDDTRLHERFLHNLGIPGNRK